MSTELASSIDDAVSAAMELSGSTAAIVGVWHGDDAAYVQGFGQSVTAGTRIRAAQASQPVACALLLDLVAQGRLTLEREISTDVPKQVGIDHITYGDLCTATSGLGDFKAPLADIFANNPTRSYPDRELLSQGLAHASEHGPGVDVEVADTNALLLMRALSALTRQPAPELLAQHVFAKADMKSSYYPSDLANDVTVEGGMTGLTRQFSDGEPVCDVDAVPVPKVSPSMLDAAGATVTTVTDLKNFYQHYLGGTFGADSPGLITDAVSTINPARDEQGNPIPGTEPSEAAKAAERFWGFGLEKAGPLYGMSGAITGTITASYRDPESGLAVVVSLNNSSPGADFARALAFQLAAIAGGEVPWTAEEQLTAMQALAVCQSSEDSEGEEQSEA